jgi:hypothetical protein
MTTNMVERETVLMFGVGKLGGPVLGLLPSTLRTATSSSVVALTGVCDARTLLGT